MNLFLCKISIFNKTDSESLSLKYSIIWKLGSLEKWEMWVFVPASELDKEDSSVLHEEPHPYQLSALNNSYGKSITITSFLDFHEKYFTYLHESLTTVNHILHKLPLDVVLKQEKFKNKLDHKIVEQETFQRLDCLTCGLITSVNISDSVYKV